MLLLTEVVNDSGTRSTVHSIVIESPAKDSHFIYNDEVSDNELCYADAMDNCCSFAETENDTKMGLRKNVSSPFHYDFMTKHSK